MGLFKKFGRLIGAGARIGLGFATGGPAGAGAAAIREVSRGANRRRQRRQRVADLRRGPAFLPGPAPFVDTRGQTQAAELIRVFGGGGTMGGGGAGGTFPPVRGVPTRGGAVVRGVDLSSVAIAQAPQMRTVVMPMPGFVTVTLPWQAFGFAAGAKIQLLKSVAVKLGLHKRTPKPMLTAGDLKTLRKADRLERKLVGLTNKHTDFRCVSKATRARATAAASSRKR